MNVAEAASTIDGFQGMNNDAISDSLFSIANFPYLTTCDDFESKPYREFNSQNWQIPIIALTLYFGLIVFGPKLMASREKGFDLRLPLAAWNAFLCIFSFIGMWKTLPYLLGSILSMPFKETVCTNPVETWSEGNIGVWTLFFAYSKLFELLDTAFIVLRKRPLLFLHWYHHVTVLLFCWAAYYTMEGSGLYFVAMNYSVHAVMYGYYCLQALKMCPKAFSPMMITLFQVAQMCIGTGVCCACWYYRLTNQECHSDLTVLIAAAVMYASYLYLFCDFAYRRYMASSKPKAM